MQDKTLTDKDSEQVVKFALLFYVAYHNHRVLYLTDNKVRVTDTTGIANAKNLIKDSDARKCCVQHSITITQALRARAFMLHKRGCLLCCSI